MADVANSIATSPQGRSNSYATSPCTSNNALVSPNIVEAIDRIFPKSPSQLLPDSACSKRTSSGGLPHSQSSVVSSLPRTVSMDLTTTDTATTATAVFTGLTSTSGTKSPLMSSTPTSQMDLPSLPAQTKVNQVSCLKNGTVDLNHKKSASPKDIKGCKRVSRADLEVMASFSNDLNSKNWKSALPDNENVDSQRPEISDSDDMCRPFVHVQKEKKKKKRKHMKSSNQRKDMDSDNSSNSPISPPAVPKISKLTIVRPAAAQGQSSEDSYSLKRSEDPLLGVENGHHSDLNYSQANPAIIETGLSDSSFSVPSSVDTFLEDVDSGKKEWKRRQKLPTARRRKYNVGKDKRQIQSTFLPCFVVLKSIAGLDIHCSTALDLSIKERVKTLSSLCAKNKFECPSKQKAIENVLSYKNCLDSSQCSNSEDEFRIPRGRSLRKRRQDICYVEPSEDDLLVELNLSKRRKHKKDSSLKNEPVDEKESVKEISPKESANTQASPVCSEPPEKKIKKKSPTSSTKNDIVFLSETKVSKENKQHSVQPEPSQKSTFIAVASAEGGSKNNNNVVSVSTSKTASSPNLVYVYPKKNVVKSNAPRSGSTPDHARKSLIAAKDKVTPKPGQAQTNKPGPASKTNRPLDVASVAPVATQSMATASKNASAASFPVGFSGTPLAASSSAQNLLNATTNANMSGLSVRNNTLPSGLCMVKIDGKDFLLSMPAANNIRCPTSTQATSIGAAAIPFPQSSLVSSQGQRLMFYQSPSVVPALRPAGLAQGIVTTVGGNPTFAIPQLPTAVTLPGRGGSSTIHLLPSTLASSSLRSAPILANTCLSTSSVTSIATSFTQSRLSCSIPSTSSTALSSSTTRTSISVPKPPSSNLLTATSGVISSSVQTSTSTAVTASLPVRQVRSLVSPLIAPGSTTVIRHHPGLSTTTSSSSVQLVAPNTAVSGARCFRIIVPGCSAAGSTARIATLGTSALSSPLTRLSASSTLLPQRKHSTDKEMSPEKRAAKRRRLEKKYPLPPGVVIKTEPLDSPPTSLTVQAGSVRSLLSTQNIQLITASSRAGVSGVQRFRIISPSAPGVMVGSRPVRLGSNVIIRAPILSPPASRPLSASSSLLKTTSASLLTSPSSSASLTVSTPSVSSSSLDTAVTTSTTASLSTSPIAVSRGTISLLSSGTLLLSSNTTSACPVPTSSVLVSSVSSSSVVTSSTSSCTALTSAQISTLSSTQPIDVSSRTEPISVSSSNSIDSSSCTPGTETGNKEDGPTASNAPATSQADSQPASNVNGSAADIVTMRQNVEKLEKLISEQEAKGLKGARLDKLKELLSQKRNALSQMEQEEGETQKRSDGDQAEQVIDICGTAEAPLVID